MIDRKAFKITSYDKTFFCNVMTYGDNTTISINEDSEIDKHIILSINRLKSEYVSIHDIGVDTDILDIINDFYELINVALTFIKKFVGITIKKCKLHDNIAIYSINESNELNLPLSLDYIIKYNMTLFEKMFHAELEEPFKTLYEDSLKVLDLPLPPFEFHLTIAPFLEPYEKEYKMSSTPRDFIRRLIDKYDRETYCNKIGIWLTQYMSHTLRIQHCEESWQLTLETVLIPPNYTSIEVPFENYCKKDFKILKYRVGSNWNYYGSCIGYYSDIID